MRTFEQLKKEFDALPMYGAANQTAQAQGKFTELRQEAYSLGKMSEWGCESGVNEHPLNHFFRNGFNSQFN